MLCSWRREPSEDRTYLHPAKALAESPCIVPTIDQSFLARCSSTTSPDGSRVLGGAPFNVAWHLRGFGANPLVISAVGDDAEGREVLERMTSWDLMNRRRADRPDASDGPGRRNRRRRRKPV